MCDIRGQLAEAIVLCTCVCCLNSLNSTQSICCRKKKSGQVKTVVWQNGDVVGEFSLLSEDLVPSPHPGYQDYIKDLEGIRGAMGKVNVCTVFYSPPLPPSLSLSLFPPFTQWIHHSFLLKK